MDDHNNYNASYENQEGLCISEDDIDYENQEDYCLSEEDEEKYIERFVAAFESMGSKEHVERLMKKIEEKDKEWRAIQKQRVKPSMRIPAKHTKTFARTASRAHRIHHVHRAALRPTFTQSGGGSSGGDDGGSDSSGDSDPPAPIAGARHSHPLTPSKRNKPRYLNRRIPRRYWRVPRDVGKKHVEQVMPQCEAQPDDKKISTPSRTEPDKHKSDAMKAGGLCGAQRERGRVA
jgi:hypothetical protein